MNKGDRRPRTGRASGDAIEEIDAHQKATDLIKKEFPWCDAPPEARKVALLADFPRSIAGKHQDDYLSWAICRAVRDNPDSDNLTVEIVKVASGIWKRDPEAYQALDIDSSTHSQGYLDVLARIRETHGLLKGRVPETFSDFFDQLAERLRYFETNKAAAGDFAIEALQDAFVWLMQNKKSWGKKGLPTKRLVKAMAQTLLKQDKRRSDFSKAYWSDLFKTAQLDWLPQGVAGRPSKRELDETQKAKQEALTAITQQVNARYDGSWQRFRDALKPASGGKKTYQQDVQAPTGPSAAKRKQNRIGNC
jgi:hypothetical protein